MADSRRRTFSRLALVVILALTPTVALAGPAQAAGACAGFSNTFSGYETSFSDYPDVITGVRGSIVSRPPTTSCTGDARLYNFAASWVMLYGYAAPSGNIGWAQAGWMATNWYGGNTLYAGYYGEYDIDGNPYNDVRQMRYDLTFTYGQNIQYAESFNYSTGREDNIVGFTVANSTNFNPLTAWTGAAAQYSSEASDVNTNVPGSPSAKTSFTNLSVQAYPSTGYTLNAAPLSYTTPVHHGSSSSASGTTSFTSWQQYP